MSLSFFSGRILTTFRAGLALNIVSSPVNGLMPLHLTALEKSEPGILPLYKQLGLLTIPIGKAKASLTEDKAEELVAMLSA
jgi:hypothetical protein